jgi:hypothetical protein
MQSGLSINIDIACTVCKLRCSRKDVMLRHYRNKHGITSLKRRDAVPQTEGYTPPPQPHTFICYGRWCLGHQRCCSCTGRTNLYSSHPVPHKEIVKRYEKYGRNSSWIVKRCGKYRRKASWIVKRYGKYVRKPSWIVKRYGKCGRKVGWIVKWYGKI